MLPLHAGSVRADEPAGEPVVVPPPVEKPAPAPRATGKKWGAYFDVGGKGGNKRYLGRGDIFIPLWQNDSTLSFLDLRIMGDDDENIEGNMGLGLRSLVSDDWIVGGYGFFDIKRSDTFGQENLFMGGMGGFEAMSEMLDFRVNGYIPGSKRQRTPELDRAALVGTTIKIKEGWERALWGVDGEVGIRIPFSEDSAMWDTRLFVGAYHFDANHVDALTGPRGRFEMRLHDLPVLSHGSRLTLETEISWDKQRDVVAFGGLKIRIPIGGTHSGRGAQLNRLERRMLDPIVRDIDIVTRNAPKTKPAYNPKTGDEIVAIRYAAAGGTGGGKSKSNPDSLQGALDGLDAVTGGGEDGVAVALHSGGDFSENVDLYEDQILVGGGGTIWVRGKNTRLLAWDAPGKRPTLWGNDNDAIVDLAVDNTLSGLDFDLSSMSSNSGIYGYNPGDVMVMDSGFFGDGWGLAGIAIESGGGGSDTMLSVTDSLFEDIDYAGDSAGIYFGGDGTAYIARSGFLDNETGVEIDSWNNATTYVSITDSYFEGNDEGINIDVEDDSFFRGEIRRNLFLSNRTGADLDVDLEVDDDDVDADIQLDVVNNEFLLNSSEGLELELWGDSDYDGTFDVLLVTNVRNNLFQANGGSGNQAGLFMELDYDVDDSDVEADRFDWTADISGNEFIANVGDGAYLLFNADVHVSDNDRQQIQTDWSFNDNLFRGNTDDGLNFDMYVHGHRPSDYVAALHLVGNTFDGNWDNGYEVDLNESGDLSVNRFTSFVKDNVFTDGGDDAIDIDTNDSGWVTDLRFFNNHITGSGGDGIDLDLVNPNLVSQPPDGRLTIHGNRIKDVDGYGLLLGVEQQAFIDFNVTDVGNRVKGSGSGFDCGGECSFSGSSGNEGLLRVNGVDYNVD